LYYLRGRAYQLQAQHARALADYEKAVELEPENAELYARRGMTLWILGQRERALEDFRVALPDQVFAWPQLWVWEIAADESDTAAAEEALQRAEATAQRDFERDLVALLRGDAQAETRLAAVEDKTDRAIVQYYRGARAWAAGDRQKAKTHFQACCDAGVYALDEHALAAWRLATLSAN